MAKSRIKGRSRSVCCDEETLTVTNSSGMADRAAMTGASLITSGRVPKSVRIFRAREFPPELTGIVFSESRNQPIDRTAAIEKAAFPLEGIGRFAEPLNTERRLPHPLAADLIITETDRFISAE